MIKNFLIISFIGRDDKLGLRINKDFFIKNFHKKKTSNEKLVREILDFIDSHNVNLDETFSVIVNQGPGSFSGIRISLAVAKGLEISKKVKLYGYIDSNLKVFDQKNIDKLLNKNLLITSCLKTDYQLFL